MSTQNSSGERNSPRKRSFIRRIVPKFLRRSGKSKRKQPSFVVNDGNDSSSDNHDNWSVNSELLGAVCAENMNKYSGKVVKVHVSPTENLKGTAQVDNMTTNSEETAENLENTLLESERTQEHGALTPTAPPADEDDTSTIGQGHSDEGEGQNEIQGQGYSSIGTIQVKLAPDDFDSDGTYKDLLKSLHSDSQGKDAVYNNNSSGIYDFPMFSDESQIHNTVPSQTEFVGHSGSHEMPEIHRETIHFRPKVKGWGMVVSGAGSDTFSSERSHFEAMLLSSAMDNSLAYCHTPEENGWGMVYTPETLEVNWSFTPIKDIFGAFWDTLSILLVSSIFLITGTAVAMVKIWQTILNVIKTIVSVIRMLTKGRRKRATKRLHVPAVRLPMSRIFLLKNPCKQIYDVLLKPLAVMFFLIFTPLLLIDGLVQKARARSQGIKTSSSQSRPSSFSARNFFKHLFHRHPYPSRGSSRVSAPLRMGSVWGRNSGGSRGCNCKCRRGTCNIL